MATAYGYLFMDAGSLIVFNLNSLSYTLIHLGRIPAAGIFSIRSTAYHIQINCPSPAKASAKAGNYRAVVMFYCYITLANQVGFRLQMQRCAQTLKSSANNYYTAYLKSHIRYQISGIPSLYILLYKSSLLNKKAIYTLYSIKNGKMITIISPAKTIDFSDPVNGLSSSSVEFPEQAKRIAAKMKTYSASGLMDLMGISSRLAYLNFERFQKWALSEDPSDSMQAVLAYKGDVYNGLQARALSFGDLEWSQDHLRILSGMYGMLRPLDRIMPYRLEFATKLQLGEYNNLYAYWEKHLDRSLASLIQTEGSGILLNLASLEYSKAIDLKRENVRVVTPVFKEYRNGELKFLSMFGKKARGMMLRYIIKNRISDIEEIKLFSEDGYSFSAPLSKTDEWVFTR